MKWILLKGKIGQGLKVGLQDSQLNFVATFGPVYLKNYKSWRDSVGKI